MDEADINELVKAVEDWVTGEEILAIIEKLRVKFVHILENVCLKPNQEYCSMLIRKRFGW